VELDVAYVVPFKLSDASSVERRVRKESANELYLVDLVLGDRGGICESGDKAIGVEFVEVRVNPSYLDMWLSQD